MFVCSSVRCHGDPLNIQHKKHSLSHSLKAEKYNLKKNTSLSWFDSQKVKPTFVLNQYFFLYWCVQNTPIKVTPQVWNANTTQMQARER